MIRSEHPEEKVGPLIHPEELPQWMAGDLVVNSTPLDWSGIKVRQYRSPPQEIRVPPLTDFSVVAYVNREAISWRRGSSSWEKRAVGPGCVSVLTRSETSHWRWEKEIEALHIYLPLEALTRTAREVFDRDIEDMELDNVLAVDDPVLTEVGFRLAREAKARSLGGRLYVEALRCQMSVHILRTYATVKFRENHHRDGLSQAQRKVLIDYIEENIGSSISLSKLADIVGMSIFHLSRRFHTEFGCPPYAYVLQRRLDFAKDQLSRKTIPLKAIAAASGFSDQSHMTRLFKRTLNLTPGEYRRQFTSVE